VNITFSVNHEGIISLQPYVITIPANSSLKTFNVTAIAQTPGHVEVTGKSSPTEVINDFNLFFRIIVAYSKTIIIVSFIVGWIYFVVWSVSFYPQIIINFKRKSVVGLSFDYLALNLIGHTLYAIFNSCLYFAPFFQDEYFQRFPRGVIPIELNDVFFSIHASIITAITVFQCFIYEVIISLKSIHLSRKGYFFEKINFDLKNKSKLSLKRT
jgi:cystinosin